MLTYEMGIGDDRVHVFCREENIPLLLEIPDDQRIAEAYSRDEIIAEVIPGIEPRFRQLRETIVGHMRKGS